MANQNPLIPIPEFENKWNPSSFIKVHKSKGADQLREIIFNLRNKKDIKQNEFERYIDQAKAKSESISPTNNIVYAFAGLGGTAMSAYQSIANPFLYIPSIILAGIAVEQVITTIEGVFKASGFKWLDIAEQLSQWRNSENDENLNG